MINANGAAEVKSWLVGVLLSIILLPASVYAQTQRTVTGTVVDEVGETIIGASVQVPDNPGIGTITDADGKFTQKD